VAERANAVSGSVQTGTSTTQEKPASTQEKPASTQEKPLPATPTKPTMFSPEDLHLTPGEAYAAATDSGYKVYLGDENHESYIEGPDGKNLAGWGTHPGTGAQNWYSPSSYTEPMTKEFGRWDPAEVIKGLETSTSVAPPVISGEAFNPDGGKDINKNVM
jgi:hypothetical protein